MDVKKEAGREFSELTETGKDEFHKLPEQTA